MELFAIFFNSFLVGFSGAMMPGPLLAVGISETPRHGWQTGPIITVGHAVAEIGVVLVLSLGLAAAVDNREISSIIGIVGGGGMIFMGVLMGCDIYRDRVSYDAAHPARDSGQKLAAKGMMATLSNPFWFVWWATTGLAFLVKSLEFGFVGPVVFYFGHILSDFVWYSAITLLLWSGKRLIVGKGMKILISLCALFLVYLGITFIYDGAGYWLKL